MPDTSEIQPEVEAELTYCVDTGIKPVSESFGSERPGHRHTGTYEPHRMTIRDGRPHTGNFSLDREGFHFVRHETKASNFNNEDEIRSVYYPETEALVRTETGCSQVLIFNHTRRAADEALREEKRVGGPVTRVHNDYTEWSGPQRVRDLLSAREAAVRLARRFQVVQVWRPTRGPVLSWPLAICDARSLCSTDLIPTERRYPDRVGEIYHIMYNPAHRWFYFPQMQRDEALVFKCYDSVTDGRARFTAHAAFDDPNTPSGAPPRESIELRALAFFV